MSHPVPTGDPVHRPVLTPFLEQQIEAYGGLCDIGPYEAIWLLRLPPESQRRCLRLMEEYAENHVREQHVKDVIQEAREQGREPDPALFRESEERSDRATLLENECKALFGFAIDWGWLVTMGDVPMVVEAANGAPAPEAPSA